MHSRGRSAREKEDKENFNRFWYEMVPDGITSGEKEVRRWEIEIAHAPNPVESRRRQTTDLVHLTKSVGYYVEGKRNEKRGERGNMFKGDEGTGMFSRRTVKTYSSERKGKGEWVTGISPYGN